MLRLLGNAALLRKLRFFTKTSELKLRMTSGVLTLPIVRYADPFEATDFWPSVIPPPYGYATIKADIFAHP